jgi:hypothetical protein
MNLVYCYQLQSFNTWKQRQENKQKNGHEVEAINNPKKDGIMQRDY